MAEITASMVKQLRESTGAGMMDAKNALTENNGDMEAAVDWLRTKGLSKAEKKSSRTAAEGLVAIQTNGTTGVVVELNSETDFVARIGGEEFAVILQDHEVQNAVDRAAEVFEKIRKEVFVHASTEIRFTVSMGIAQLTKGENSDQWIKRADQALYDSKHGGRNRWTVAAAPGMIKKVA